MIETKLISANNSQIEIAPNKYFNLAIKWNAGLSPSVCKELFCTVGILLRQTLQDHPTLQPEQISRINKKGIFDAKGHLVSSVSGWKKIEVCLAKGRLEINLPEEPIEADSALVTFSNRDKPHYLDGIQYPRPKQNKEESRDDFVRRCTQERLGQEFDPETSKTKKLLNGVSLSMEKRSHYQMAIEPKPALACFLNRSTPLTSTMIFAKNGLIEGAVVSSMDQKSPTVGLMRVSENEEEGIDCTIGRPHNFDSAKDLASFGFLSQLRLYLDPNKAHLAQGIQKVGDEYIFEFATQSLVAMTFKEGEMVQKEIQAFRELAREPILIHDPQDSGKTYRVQMKPFPVATCQFNWLNQVEQLLPASLSGEERARDQSNLADQALFSRALERLPRYDTIRQQQITDTIHHLESGRLKPWQEIMARSYLCLLTDLPLFLHCKSCVDRTNVANAIVVAMKQWLRSGKEVPLINGRYTIFEIANVEFDKMSPFKELFSFALQQGLKTTELARGIKGYKFYRDWRQHPALRDLLPDRYLTQEPKSIIWKRVALFALAYLPALALIFLTWTLANCLRPWRLVTRLPELILAPFKLLVNGNAFFQFSQRKVNESYELVGIRSLIE